MKPHVQPDGRRAPNGRPGNSRKGDLDEVGQHENHVSALEHEVEKLASELEALEHSNQGTEELNRKVDKMKLKIHKMKRDLDSLEESRNEGCKQENVHEHGPSPTMVACKTFLGSLLSAPLKMMSVRRQATPSHSPAFPPTWAKAFGRGSQATAPNRALAMFMYSSYNAVGAWMLTEISKNYRKEEARWSSLWENPWQEKENEEVQGIDWIEDNYTEKTQGLSAPTALAAKSLIFLALYPMINITSRAFVTGASLNSERPQAKNFSKFYRGGLPAVMAMLLPEILSLTTLSPTGPTAAPLLN